MYLLEKSPVSVPAIDIVDGKNESGKQAAPLFLILATLSACKSFAVFADLLACLCVRGFGGRL